MRSGWVAALRSCSPAARTRTGWNCWVTNGSARPLEPAAWLAGWPRVPCAERDRSCCALFPVRPWAVTLKWLFLNHAGFSRVSALETGRRLGGNGDQLGRELEVQ